MYIGVMAVGGHKLWGWVEWFGGDAVICGRRKIDSRRREGCGPGMPGPYGGAKGKRLLTGRCAGGMNPSPTGYVDGRL